MKCPSCEHQIYNMLDEPGWFWCPHCCQKHEGGVVPSTDLSWSKLSDDEKNNMIAREVLGYRVDRTKGTWTQVGGEWVVQKMDFVNDRNEAIEVIEFACGPAYDRVMSYRENFLNELLSILFPDHWLAQTTGSPGIFGMNSSNRIEPIHFHHLWAIATASPSNMMLALLRSRGGVDIRD